MQIILGKNRNLVAAVGKSNAKLALMWSKAAKSSIQMGNADSPLTVAVLVAI